MKQIKMTLLASAAMILVACGGGSSGGTTPDNEDIPDTNTENVTITTSAEAVTVGTTYTVNWTSEYAEPCVISGSLDSIQSNDRFINITPEIVGEQNTTITCGTSTASISVNVLPEYTNIPDPMFENALISMGIDDVVDNRVATNSILQVNKLYISGRYPTPPPIYTDGYYNRYYDDDNAIDYYYYLEDNYIKDVTGLENFVNLIHLQIENQQVESIDLSQLTKLKILSAWGNPITSLNVDKNTELRVLGISETSLTTIDTSKLINLVEVPFQNDADATLPYATSNGTVVYGLTSVDFSQNQNITRIYLHNNPLTDFGISQNKNSLQELWANKTDIETLDLSGFTKLNYIILSDSSNLEYLNIDGVNYGNVPFRLYCENCPSLNEIVVTSVSATQAAIDSGIGVHIDDHIQLVGGE